MKQAGTQPARQASPSSFHFLFKLATFSPEDALCPSAFADALVVGRGSILDFSARATRSKRLILVTISPGLCPRTFLVCL